MRGYTESEHRRALDRLQADIDALDRDRLVKGGCGRTGEQVRADAGVISWALAFALAACAIVGLTVLWAWASGRIELPLTLAA